MKAEWRPDFKKVAYRYVRRTLEDKTERTSGSSRELCGIALRHLGYARPARIRGFRLLKRRGRWGKQALPVQKLLSSA